MAGNTAEDYSDRLNQARNAKSQMPNAQPSHPGDLHISKNGQADNYGGESNSTDRLAAARERDEKADIGNKNKSVNVTSNLMGTAGNVAKAINPTEAASTMNQINLIMDMPFVAAFGAALLKDLLDTVAGPTVILAILFSILCSIFIFMMLLLVSANDKRGMAKSLIKRGAILIGGGLADSIPGIDFLPIESLTVAVIYYLTLVERKNAQE
jgi:hypothetical protein